MEREGRRQGRDFDSDSVFTGSSGGFEPRYKKLIFRMRHMHSLAKNMYVDTYDDA